MDRNRVAVELARLSIWVHTFVPGLPLSLLDHNLVCGDSLTGVGTLDEVVTTFDPDADPEAPSLFESQLLALLSRAETALRRLARTSDATKKEIDEAREAHREAQAAVAPARALFDLMTAHRAGICPRPERFDEATFIGQSQSHAVQETIQALTPLHFPAAFPQVFLRKSAGFDCLLGNPPWEEATVEELAFWSRHFPGLKAIQQAQQRRMIDGYRRSRPDLVREYDSVVKEAASTRTLLINGPFPGMGTADPDLYKAFAWKFWHLCSDGGTIGVVLPRSIFATLGNTEWRKAVISSAQINVVFVVNEREWAFTDVNPGYGICFVSVIRGRSNENIGINIRGTYRTQLEYSKGLALPAATLTPSLLQKVDANLCIPKLRSDGEFAVLEKMYRHRSFGETARSDFFARPHTDFHATNDRDEYLAENECEHPVYNHRNVDHLRFDPRAGTFAYADFDYAIAELVDRRVRNCRRRRSPYYGMDTQWIENRETLPALNPRVVFRDVVHASNPRKLWFALAPADTILTNAAPYLLFHRGDSRIQAYLLGIVSSTILDWIGHLKVNLHLNYFILNSLPIPEYSECDSRCDRLGTLAVGLALTCDGDYGVWNTIADPIVGDEARRDALDELDACSASLYGLAGDDIAMILNSYPEDLGQSRRTRSVHMHFRRWEQHR